MLLLGVLLKARLKYSKKSETVYHRKNVAIPPAREIDDSAHTLHYAAGYARHLEYSCRLS